MRFECASAIINRQQIYSITWSEQTMKITPLKFLCSFLVVLRKLGQNSPWRKRPIPNSIGLWFMSGVCLVLLWACSNNPVGNIPVVNSFEEADRVVREQLLPNITIAKTDIPDAIAGRYKIAPIAEPLPKLEDFPLFGAQPTSNRDITYLEILGSAEKSNGTKQDERWLVDVAEAFNRKQVKTSEGQVIQVGIRNISSGIAARLLASQTVRPAGFSPSNHLWLKMLEQKGLEMTEVATQLVPNGAGFVVEGKVYQQLASQGDVTFERLLAAILANQITIGYPNPYSSSASLNLLYTLFWQSAGHAQNKKPLTVAELQSPQVNSVFAAFQKQVLLTSTNTLELKEIFIRDRQKLQAFPLEYQSYVTLKKLPGFEDVAFVPFGLAHDSPLVGFGWNSAAQQEALKRFAEFATSSAMQTLAQQQGFSPLAEISAKAMPMPSGEVLQAAQSFWKLRKDGGRSVYLMTVIDTSGSMAGERLQGVKASLKLAAQQINPGNYLGMTTFGDQPQSWLPLATFDGLQHQRLLAAIDSLQADGSTAMYDGVIAGLAELMAKHKTDPNGRFYLLLLSDGEVNRGLKFEQVKAILSHSGVRIYPISYGEVNQGEMKAIAALREATVKSGTPKNLQLLLKDLFQTTL
jgi:Ca-activated chloride channel homolog